MLPKGFYCEEFCNGAGRQAVLHHQSSRVLQPVNCSARWAVFCVPPERTNRGVGGGKLHPLGGGKLRKNRPLPNPNRQVGILLTPLATQPKPLGGGAFCFNTPAHFYFPTSDTSTFLHINTFLNLNLFSPDVTMKKSKTF